MIDVQEEFCFDEEYTEGAIASPKTVIVNITRSSPACGAAFISLKLSFKNNGKIVCKFMQWSGFAIAELRYLKEICFNHVQP